MVDNNDRTRDFVETQVVAAGAWVVMSMREQYLRNKLGPAGYERHSIKVTAALGVTLVLAAIVFFLAGITGWHGAALSICGFMAVLLGLPGLSFIRCARVRHVRLIRGMYGG